MKFSEKQVVTTSKFLSLVLRHKPQVIGLDLDSNGWANVVDLIRKASQAKHTLSLELLQYVVQTNDKKRFSFNDDGTQIRANQGHSVDVDLGLTAIDPPPILFHGTAERFISSILATGLQKRQRHHVHLSENKDTAIQVGRRYGVPVLLAVDARQMAQDGVPFYQADNQVWLTDEVPSRYLTIVSTK